MALLNKNIPVHVRDALSRIPILTRLLYIVALIDGNEDQEELEMILKIARYFRYNPESVKVDYNFLKTLPLDNVIDFTRYQLTSVGEDAQSEYIAALIILANSNGKMEQQEWKFLYGLYAKELNLNYDRILEKQKIIRLALNSISA